jgi:hypothetical protein
LPDQLSTAERSNQRCFARHGADVARATPAPPICGLSLRACAGPRPAQANCDIQTPGRRPPCAQDFCNRKSAASSRWIKAPATP